MLGRLKKVYATDIIAVSYTGSEICNFERSEAFWIYAVDEDKVVRMQILSVYSKDMDDTIDQLKACRIDGLICRNYGPRAMSKLKAAGFSLYSFDGGARAAVNAFAAGKLQEM
ncbi:MAG: NifB/NifX family molybdenum-iron cluster-binding protein [Eubacterium sp.]|nr:NifB/NifX family molybdenum-iron cluster-binding protein [Eubacterium sp.]